MHQNGGLTRNGSIKKVKKSYSRSQTLLEKFSGLTMAGVRLELGIQRAFTRWGTFCARHPLVVIAGSIAVCVGLSVGIIWLKVRILTQGCSIGFALGCVIHIVAHWDDF